MSFITIISVFVVLFPFVKLKYWYIIFAVGSASILGVTLKVYRPVQMATEVLEPEKEEDVIAESGPNRDLLIVANNFARKVFGPDSLPLEEIEKWYNKNPLALCVLRNRNNEFLGYFDIYPLNELGVNLLKKGSGEKDIEPEHILGPKEMKKAKALYLAGIAVVGHETGLHKERTAKLFWAMADYISHYYGDKPRTVLAIAATPEGERLLKSPYLNSKIIKPKDVRADGHNLYLFKATKKVILETKSRAEKRTEPPYCKWR